MNTRATVFRFITRRISAMEPHEVKIRVGRPRDFLRSVEPFEGLEDFRNRGEHAV